MAPSRPSLTDLFLRLPREIRDPIYSWVLEADGSVPLKRPHLQNVPSVFWRHPTIYYEALEALYKINAIEIDLSSEPFLLSEIKAPRPEPKAYIRHLIVMAEECQLPPYSHDAYEHDCHNNQNHHRERWAQLLDVPHLQSLTVNLQKMHNDNLETLDFGPILYHLRTLRPGLAIKFNISFDHLLETMWNDPIWNANRPAPSPLDAYGSLFASSPFLGAAMRSEDAAETEDPYQPMGFSDVSEMIQPPTDEDKSYVAEYLPTAKMPPPRPLERGLLSETPANRRFLATNYIVREPALLRVQMQQHYEVYMNYEKMKKGEMGSTEGATETAH